MSYKQLDICFNRHSDNENSNAAFEKNVSKASAQRAVILEFIRQMGSYGAICEEIEDALEIAHQTCSARCSELKRDGLVKVVGRRTTSRGCFASILEAV